ncbi:response regulator [Paenibacillus pini]|uniref:Circadian input-output histidine kinase CikA n=1 Tax=Paenibacillus pini JCM 16418 TaxID=1236976 RepID=W7YX62_9BACL|nr:response regulator [Paenibacillus pini]GAF09301.1 signal transduction histidine kinase [Paenibacillus pini JCM 16418]
MEHIQSDDKLYRNLNDAAGSILEMISEIIQVNTFFVASNDKVSNTILKAFNRNELLIQEGTVLPYDQTYCSLVIEKGAKPLIIDDTSIDPLTCGMEITHSLGSSSFIGVPIWRKDGQVFGTICAMDQNAYTYNERDITLLNAMATFLSYVIELENTVSDLQESQQETMQAKVIAEKATQAKTDFLAIMSHEIRTPMNGIMGMTSLLQETDLTEEQREYTDIIRDSNESLISILNDILDFSKMESGKMRLEHQPFDLKSSVEDILDLFASRTAEKEVELVSYIDPDIPPFLLGDVTRIRQVLVNLIGNAVKFTASGEIFVSVMKRSTEHSKTFELYVTVRDTGIGIAEEKQDQLFQSFSQVHAPGTSSHYGGTGLGLAICKQLVELMGGHIELKSTEGEGSSFQFTIAAESADLFPVNENQGTLLRQKRVLIVDDNSTNLRVLRTVLEKWGMIAKATVSAHEALLWIEQGDIFDLAIIDMRMQEMDGIQLGYKIRKYRTQASLPLIMLTSLGTDLRDIDLESVYSAVVTKPVRDQQLKEVILSSLSENHAAPTKKARPTLLDSTLSDRLPLRILVAEDNAVNQKLLLRVLQKMGYSADVVTNGLEVIQILGNRHYDLVFMDVQMPVMDGIEATQRIMKQMDASKRPVIIAVTANARQEDKEKCLNAGMSDYVSKPLRINDVQRLLEYWANHIRSSELLDNRKKEQNYEGIIDIVMIDEIRSLDDSTTFIQEIYQMFDTEATACIKRINELWEVKDITPLAETVHTLKGFSLNVGAAQLAQLCIQLEQELTHAKEIEMVIDALHDVFEKTKFYLKQQISEEH